MIEEYIRLPVGLAITLPIMIEHDAKRAMGNFISQRKGFGRADRAITCKSCFSGEQGAGIQSLDNYFRPMERDDSNNVQHPTGP